MIDDAIVTPWAWTGEPGAILIRAGLDAKPW
jgi:hypothetical protein